jgi:autotransporter-associated beta strand protein
LTGDNLYAGATTINGGTLTLSGTGSIADSSDVVDDGTLDISATTSGASILTLSGTGAVTLGAETLTLSDASTTFSGAIDGSGGLTLTTGTETLTGDNLYTGVTTINGGTLKLSGTGSIADSSDVVDNGTLDISGTTSGASIVTLSGDGAVTLGAETLTLTMGASTFSGVIGGSGGLTVDGSGIELLSGVNTYSGATTIGSGETLALSGTGSIAKSSGVADSGTFDISATTSGASIKTLSGSGAVKLGNETLTLTNASTTFSGTINSTGGGITVASGILALGALTLDDLTLAGNFSDSATLTVNDNVTFNGVTLSGGTLDISGILDSNGTTTISGATVINSDHVDVVGGTFTIDPTPFTNNGTFEVKSSAVFSGEVHTETHGVVHIDQEVVTNTNGTIQIDHGGTLTLFDTTINGGQIVDNGTLLLTGTTSKLENVTFTGAATLDISSGSTLELSGSVSGVTVNFENSSGHSGLILDNPGSFTGVISGLVESSDGIENHENYVDLVGFTDSSQHHAKVLSAVYNSHTGITAVTLTNGTSQPNLTIDLQGNYSHGGLEFASDGNGGTLLSDPAVDSGAVTIGSGVTLNIGGASSAAVTFTNGTANTGDLVLADSKDFTGTITGFAGDGTVANSDLIDAMDVNFADVATSKTTYLENAAGTGGTLTLHDANGQALDSISFTGNYQLANFTIESDGDGGTLIVDPPVKTGGQAPGGTPAASNQNLASTAGTDGFVFNFGGHHHAPTTDFHPDVENFQPGGSMLTNLHTGSNAPPDQGHSNMPLGGDGQDHVGLSAFAKAHLHAADFHFV